MTKARTITDASAPSRDAQRGQVIGADAYLPPVHASRKAALYEMRSTAVTADDLGVRAAGIRTQRDMTVVELARRSGVTVDEIEAFERGDGGSVTTLVALHRTLSGEIALDQLFSTPRFETIDDVVAYEARRRGT